MLDTNVWIHYLKRPNSAVAERLKGCKPADVVTCAIVRAELLYGAMKYGNPDRRLAIVQETLAPYA
jgi:tRNA(fMet)-specific endonuclease VapC